MHCWANETPTVIGPATPERRRPFATGERLQYDVSFTRIHVGSGEMSITTDTIRGEKAWKASFSVSGGFAKLSVRDTTISWFDTLTFNSLRFVQRLHEPHDHANRDTQIFPERQTFRPRDEDEQPSVAGPLDDVSLVYFVRTLPLEPGQCYELRRYYKPSGNPVVIHVLRRERIKVSAGTFNAIVLRPEITTSGIFSQHGRAELWLSDDSARVVLQLKSQLPFGSINLYLKHAGTAPPSN